MVTRGEEVFANHMVATHAQSAVMGDQLAAFQYDAALYFLRVLGSALDTVGVHPKDADEVQELVALALVPSPLDAASRARDRATMEHLLARGLTWSPGSE